MEPKQGSDQPPQGSDTATPSTTPSDTASSDVKPTAEPTPEPKPTTEATSTAPDGSTASTPVPPVANIKSSTTPPTSSGKSKSMFVIVGVVILALILIGGTYFILHGQEAKQPAAIAQHVPTPTSSASTTPAVTPVTSANVDQTLNNTNSAVQQDVNQANTDLNNISNINTSQDNTGNL